MHGYPCDRIASALSSAQSSSSSTRWNASSPMVPSARSADRRCRSASTARRRRWPGFDRAVPAGLSVAAREPVLVPAPQHVGEVAFDAIQNIHRGLSGLPPGELDLAIHRIVVLQVEAAHQRPEREALHDQGSHHHAEGGEQHQVAVRESAAVDARGRQGERRGERHRSPHAGPGHDHGRASCSRSGEATSRKPQRPSPTRSVPGSPPR